MQHLKPCTVFNVMDYINLSMAIELYNKNEFDTLAKQRLTSYIKNSNSIDQHYDILLCLSDTSNLMDLFDVYFEYLNLNNWTREILDCIYSTIQHLTLDSKTCILNFLYSIKSIRLNLQFIDKIDLNLTGYDYQTKSIFSPIISSHVDYVDYVDYVDPVASKAFKSLYRSTTQLEFDSIFKYMLNIAESNRAYTFYNVQDYQHTLSKFDLLGTVLIIVSKLCANNPEYVNIANMWQIVDIIYFTSFDIKKQCLEIIEFHQNLDIDASRQHVIDNRLSLDRILKIYTLANTHYLNQFIFDNFEYIINPVDASKLSRMLIYLLEIDIRDHRLICKSILSILKSKCPPNLKSDYMRFLMAYSDVDLFIRLESSQDALIDYLFKDVRTLDIGLIHSIDILKHFKSKLYGSNLKICRLYLGYIESITELYNTLKQMHEDVGIDLNSNPENMIRIVRDVNLLASYVDTLIDILKTWGNEAMSYIDPLVKLINSMCTVFGYVSLNTISDISISDISISNITYSVDRFKPQLIELIDSLKSKVDPNADISFRLDRTPEAVKIFALKQDTIEILDSFGISNVEQLDVETLDVDDITCDVAYNPIRIPISAGSTEYKIIDLKTLHKLMMDGLNPYTRQNITYEEIERFNGV